MALSIPTIDIALFGTYPSYLATQLGGLRTARGLIMFGAYGKYAEFVESDGGGDESMKI